MKTHDFFKKKKQLYRKIDFLTSCFKYICKIVEKKCTIYTKLYKKNIILCQKTISFMFCICSNNIFWMSFSQIQKNNLSKYNCRQNQREIHSNFLDDFEVLFCSSYANFEIELSKQNRWFDLYKKFIFIFQNDRATKRTNRFIFKKILRKNLYLRFRLINYFETTWMRICQCKILLIDCQWLVK